MENKPTHYVYHVAEKEQTEGEEKRGFWTKIGAAWAHGDGKGFTLAIDLLPLNGRIVLREPREDEPKQEPQEPVE